MSTKSMRVRSLTALAIVAGGAGVAAPSASALVPLPVIRDVAPALALPSSTPSSQRTCTDAPRQELAAYGDQRGYVLLPGGDFSDVQGWQLSGGAAVVRTTQRDGRIGPVLSVPAGATVVSPLFCVDLRYASARAFTRLSGGATQVSLGVLTPAGTLLGEGAAGGTLTGATAWAPTGDLSADPRIAGQLGQYRSVAFRLRNTGSSTLQVDDVYLDPRMR